MKTIVKILFFLSILLLNFSCDSIDPDINRNGIDTTSHNFTFQTWTFGEHSSSVLYDVAIIDENNIWAVGEIYVNDTHGQPDPTPYNAAHWDGSSWEIKRIPTKTFSGTVVSSQIRTIFVFSENDIWTFSIAGSYSHWNGSNWETEFVNERDGSGNKFWGTSSSNLYLVCNNGGITYYNGTSWEKLESGTDVDIQDIWGISDGSSNPFILCAASNVLTLGENKILRIINTEVDTINWGTGRRVHSVWFNSKEKIYACGGGVFFSSAPNYNWIEQTDVPLYFTERVRGKERNDLFVVGHYGLLAHFNGATWKTYPEASTAVIYKSLDYKNNLMVTVGLTETQAIIQFMLHN